MADSNPIEIPIEEAEKLVEPESLEDALTSLKTCGFISKFRIRISTILIWPTKDRRLEVPFVTESLETGKFISKRRTRQ